MEERVGLKQELSTLETSAWRNRLWETDFYPVPVLGRFALSLSLSLSMRFPDRSPVLEKKKRSPMGPEILSNTGAGICKKAPKAFPDSSCVLDK